MKLTPEREAQLAKLQDLGNGSHAFTECTPEEYGDFIGLLRERIVASPWKTTKEIIREEAKRGDMTAVLVAGVFELTPAEREAHRMEHEIKMREFQQGEDFYDKITPLMDEAIGALGMITIDEAMKWHAARGNEFAQAYLKHVNSFEYQQRRNEIDAAMNWHPAWHQHEDRSWGCDDPEVRENDKLLAQYRRHLANQN